ncbi:rotatin isoform X2 [Anguilla rostrata]|uniref:rotatin isoform X2 n=1 Tax=Anguilla rostrata TaxID=7938 RepID=UPI0030CCB2B3
MELSTLIKKTGHRLVEIRVRALQNIKCKLDHGLLSIPDLVQEKMLFVCLLEWFNFPEVPMQREVLEILNALAEHPTAAQMLRDVGAVEFLTQLSPNVEPQLQAVIDGIFDQLFHLPELLSNFPGGLSSGQQLTSSHNTGSVLAHFEEESPVMGYFQKSSKTRNFDIPPQRIAVRDSVRCLKFSTFPWLTLTTTDRHILSSNESSLRSSNHNLVRTTCELLQDVIMQDFPAEIFLQRPSIVNNLFSLLKLGMNDASYLTLHAVACLLQLCTNLRSRLRFHRDPSFYSAKQDAVSQNSSMSYSQEIRGTRQSLVSSPEECSPRPSVVGRTGQRARGDGQDGDAASSSGSSSQAGPAPGPPPQSPLDAAHLELPETEGEDVLELRLRQLSLAQFSAAVFEHALPLLQTERMKAFLSVLELLSEALLLLGDSVSEQVWEDSSLIGQELAKKLQGSMECLGNILCHHHSGSSEQSEAALVHRRMTYVGTAVFTVRLLQTLLPVEQAAENLPESAGTALFLLCVDAPFGEAFPGIHESAVAYLEQGNPESHATYRRVAQAARAAESTCTFLKEVHAEGDKNWSELLELADQAIYGLPYHQHLPVVKECIQICSYVWKFAQASPLLQAESQKMFLRLLSHPLQAVKAETYTCTLNVVKDCLGVQNVTKPVSSICSGVNFLLNAHVLYEISTFGLQDQAEKVKCAARDILLFLLQGQLMMTPPTWNKFIEAACPVIPILQGYAGAEDALGNCILLISEASNERRDGAFSNATRLRAAIRLLFSKHPAVRGTAAQHLLPHLTSADGLASRPPLERAALEALPSLYVVNKLVDIKLNDSDRSLLKVESVSKLYSILASETVDLVLRRSAAEQLAVVLQDTAMHAVLKSLGLVEKVTSFIQDCVNSKIKNTDCLLEPCFSMLRKLVTADPSLRHTLAQRPAFLVTLLRASLIVKEDAGDLSEAAALMCMLMFDESARMDLWTDSSDARAVPSPFSVPVSVIRRYDLPLQASSHHAVSPYCVVLPPYADLKTLKPAWEMLQFAWNRAWHSGIDNLLEQLKGYGGDLPEFHADLTMPAAQGALLKVTHVSSGLRDCLESVRGADSHSAVGCALARLRFYLLTDRLALKLGSDSSKSVLKTLGWRPAIERFLQVQPACTEDEKLLADIVAFLNAFFKQQKSEADEADVRWILELLLKQERKTLLGLLVRGEAPPPGDAEEARDLVTQRLQKALSGFFNTLLHRLAHTSDRMSLALAGPFKTQLAAGLLQCLRVSDAPHFYGLPSLERTLRGMAHVTALPGWSSGAAAPDSLELCVKYLSGLLEVISSFYVEWGGNSMSFMGKGVTKNAVLCLLHLSYEMMSESKDKDWMSLWSLSHDQSSDEPAASHLGLAWLIPLWVDRDPEVRFASLGVGSALTAVPSGCLALAASCQNISGGLWATLLSILLDQQECSMVRREAAFILQNLLVMPMPASMEEAKDCAWQGPCVHDESSGLSLVGLPALQALLYHCQFFEHIGQAVRSCYQGRYTFDLTFPRAPSLVGSVTEDFDDSLKHWRCPTGPLNQGPESDSQSTSSTLILPEEPGESCAPPLSSSRAPTQQIDSRLVAQGQSDTSDSGSSRDSRAGEGAPEPRAIVTPHLASAVAGLLANLLAVLPEFTLSALEHGQTLAAFASLVDVGPIERCLGELKTPGLLPGNEEDAKNQVLSLFQFLSSFSKLFQSCVIQKPELVSRMEFIKPLLASAFTLLTLNIEDIDAGTRSSALHTWVDALALLAALLRADSAAVLPSVAGALGKHWQPFSGALSLCVRLSSERPALYSAALRFLAAALSEEAKRRAQEVARFGKPGPATPLSRLLSVSPGAQLCEVLLESFEKQMFQDPLKKVSAWALMSLLASSPSAQTHALKAGLIDSSVEQMKHTYTQLHLESLKPGKASQRKKEESCMRELKMILQILRNCLYNHDECKTAASDSRLAHAVHALWPWLLQDDRAMEAALELLCVYTANCTAACSSLCWSNAGQGPFPRGPTNSSLMHSVMKLASHVAAENSPVQRLAFSLLSNLAISRDCKGVLQKSNFLQYFLSIPLPKPGSKSPNPSVSLWLKLLLNMSFGEDGQQTILKINGSLELLTEMSQYKHNGNRPAALLILHNICFSSANKPKILASDKSVEVLVSCLESKLPDIRAVGASALWALLHNNQKAKVTLKCPSVRAKVDEAYASAKKEAEENKDEALNSYLLKCLAKLAHLLNN